MAQERKIYDFNSVGQLPAEESISFSKDKPAFPIGIATPIRLSRNIGTVFEMHTSISKTVKDNFRNLILTNHGERLMLHDFGANLKPLAYQLGSDEGNTAAISRISKAVQKYMPYVSLHTFESVKHELDDGSLTKLGVRIIFSAPSLGVAEQALEVMIATAG